jgi:uncharacterized damage-inducible protein DinB
MSNTDSNTSKAQLLEDLQAEQAQWEALLHDIGEEHMTQPGVAGEWSIKDIVAHLTGWRRRTVGRFQAALRHEPTPPPDWPQQLQTDDEINAWIYAGSRDRPLADVLRESRDVFGQLVETLDAFPEADLRDPTRFPWLEGEPLSGAIFFAHFHEEHEPDMRAWLEKIRLSQADTPHQEKREMADETFTLTTFYTSWKEYQDRLKAALAPLTAEQLALRAAPDLRSVGENAAHIIGTRAGWFTFVLHEDAGADVKAIASWDEHGEPARSAAELARGLDITWRMMADCLARWSPADMQQTFPDDWEGQTVYLSRAWIVWHVLEHDLHHGGEVSLTLGMHGLQAGFTS